MTKINYGKRLGKHYNGYGIISNRVEYDADLDKAMREDTSKIAAAIRNMPLHKRELFYYEVNQKAQATKAKKSNAVAIRSERLEAEQRMEEAVRKAVDLLEFHMNDLINTRSMGNDKGLVRQATIHDAIFMLRNKCGVTFEHETEYDHRYQKPFEVPMQITETYDRRSEQREERQRHMREMAEKFAAARQKKAEEDG